MNDLFVLLPPITAAGNAACHLGFAGDFAGATASLILARSTGE